MQNELPNQSEPVDGDQEQGLSRRMFLTQAGIAGLAAGSLLAGSAHAQPGGPGGPGGMAPVDLFPGAVDAEGRYVLPELPYAYDALEPHIDAETMELHHSRHHAGYVRGLIAAEEKLAEARESGNFDLVKAYTQAASFNGGGHFLHCVFWASMGPNGGGQPQGPLAARIQQDFGSFDAFVNHFKSAAVAVEGSGWGILAWSVPAGKLVVLQAEKHNLLSQWGQIPLLAVDVWEHAYYKKYGPGRADYVNAFMNVVNWEDVSRRFTRSQRFGRGGFGRGGVNQ